MTVKELIDKLQTLDPTLRVFIPGYEGGYEDIKGDFGVDNFCLDVYDEWWYGPHERSVRCLGMDKEQVKGIVL